MRGLGRGVRRCGELLGIVGVRRVLQGVLPCLGRDVIVIEVSLSLPL